MFADLIGKGGHVRTVPVPDWVGSAIQAWLTAAAVTAGPMFRAINKAGRVAPNGFSPKVIWSVVTTACRSAVCRVLLPMTFGAMPYAGLCRISCQTRTSIGGRRDRFGIVSLAREAQS